MLSIYSYTSLVIGAFVSAKNHVINGLGVLQNFPPMSPKQIIKSSLLQLYKTFPVKCGWILVL